MRPFLLCDPGLVRPPGQSTDSSIHQRFWERLVGWATDRRVRLGSESLYAVFRKLEEMGWPDFEPPQCPPALARDARKALTLMLSSVAPNGMHQLEGIPLFDPKYVLDDELGMALALDVGEQGNEYLLGTASDPAHWERQEAVVYVKPSHVGQVSLVAEPHQRTSQELDLEAKIALKGVRIIIVGARKATYVYKKLYERFGVTAERIIWVETEKGQKPNLDCLQSVRSKVDLVVCVTGMISHAASEKTIVRARRGGVEPILVERVGEIIGGIRERLIPSGH